MNEILSSIHQTIAIILLVAILAGATLFHFRKEEKKNRDIYIPPSPQRSDLGFCMFGSAEEQVEQTRGWVNRHFTNFWPEYPLEDSIADIGKADMPTVLDLSRWLFLGTRGSRVLAPPSELRGFFDKLQAAGVLHLVKWFTVCDEPNLKENSDIEHLVPLAVSVVLSVAKEYPELDENLRPLVIYTTGRPYTHIELFKDVGWDNYDAKSSIFAEGGDYDNLVAQLRPDQKVWLVAGAYQGQNPEPFLNFANGHPRVDCIVVFLHTPPRRQEPNMVGIRDIPEMLSAWKATGLTICSASK